MSERIPGSSLPHQARLAGALWLIVIIAGVAAYIARTSVIVRGDAAATGARILASESLFRAGLAADLLAGACYLAVTLILYQLLKPVGRTTALVAAAFGAVGVAVGAATAVTHLGVLVALGGASFTKAIPDDQLQALAYMALRLQGQASNLSMAFFGLQCLSVGCLIARSSFLPRLLGVLLALGGASYVINAYASFVAPGLAAQFGGLIVPIALIGEGALSLWLVVFGVDVPKWEEQTARTNAGWQVGVQTSGR